MVIFSVSAEPLNVYDLRGIEDVDDEPIVVSLDVEDDAVVLECSSAWIPVLHLIRVFPIGILDISNPLFG